MNAFLLVAAFQGSYDLLDPQQDHTARAIELDEAGDLIAAIESFRAAAQFAPHDPDVWFNLGTSLEGQVGHNSAHESEIQLCFDKANRLQSGEPVDKCDDATVDATLNKWHQSIQQLRGKGAGIEALQEILQRQNTDLKVLIACGNRGPTDEDPLTKWLKNNGAMISESVGISTPTSGRDRGIRGVYANRFIPAQTVLIEIPKSLILCSSFYADSPDGQRLVSHSAWDRTRTRTPGKERVKEPHQALVVLAIAKCKSTPSCSEKFAPLFAALPADLSAMPVLWPEAKLEAHTRSNAAYGHWLETEVATLKEQIAGDYAALVEMDPSIAELLTLDTFQRYAVIEESRVFHLTRADDADYERGLVPYIDLINHARPPRSVTFGFNKTTQMFEVRNTRDLGADDQLTYEYFGGARLKCGSNSQKKRNAKCSTTEWEAERLLHYGFVPAGPEMADPDVDHFEIGNRLGIQEEYAKAARAFEANVFFKEKANEASMLDYLSLGQVYYMCAVLESRDYSDYERSMETLNKAKLIAGSAEDLARVEKAIKKTLHGMSVDSWTNGATVHA